MPARHKILMCRPDHFTVSYNINPWMDGEEGEVSRGRALAQWQALRDALARIADVELIPAQPQLPDMVFTANAGVMNGRRVIVSRFSPPERRGEEPHFRDWFASRGFEVVPWPEELVFEGAGDALLDRGGPWVWAGYGQRTALAAHERLAAFYPEREVVSLRLVDPYYYHIDTCLAPLEGGYLLYYPEAFDDKGHAEIERRVAPERRIAVNAEEADALSCNAVNLDRHVILNNPSERLRGVLETVGFEVIGVDVSEFMKSGGAAKCLVLRLDEP